jgi:hypothetical protein
LHDKKRFAHTPKSHVKLLSKAEEFSLVQLGLPQVLDITFPKLEEKPEKGERNEQAPVLFSLESVIDTNTGQLITGTG